MRCSWLPCADVINVRRITSDEWQAWRLLRRRALDESPAAFGSTLEEWSGAGDTEERWRHRLEAVPVNLLADRDDVAVAMVSVTEVHHDEAEIISMWVAPEARRLGIAQALLAAAIGYARDAGAQAVALDVMPDNEPAIRCYAKAGFVDVGWAPTPNEAVCERRMQLRLR